MLSTSCEGKRGYPGAAMVQSADRSFWSCVGADESKSVVTVCRTAQLSLWLERTLEEMNRNTES